MWITKIDRVGELTETQIINENSKEITTVAILWDHKNNTMKISRRVNSVDGSYVHGDRILYEDKN